MKRCSAAERNSASETPRLKSEVGGYDRLGKVEQAEACGADMAVVPTAASHVEARPGLDLRRDLIFIACDIVGIDFSVFADVESGKEARRILLHLVESELPVMVEIGLTEPVRERIVVRARRPEGFAHGADEDAVRPVRHRRGIRRLTCGGGEQEERGRRRIVIS